MIVEFKNEKWCVVGVDGFTIARYDNRVYACKAMAILCSWYK